MCFSKSVTTYFLMGRMCLQLAGKKPRTLAKISHNATLFTLFKKENNNLIRKKMMCYLLSVSVKKLMNNSHIQDVPIVLCDALCFLNVVAHHSVLQAQGILRVNLQLAPYKFVQKPFYALKWAFSKKSFLRVACFHFTQKQSPQGGH